MVLQLSISLELLTHALAKAKIFSSQEEEILRAIKYLTTPLEATEESSFKDSCASDGEQLFEQEIEEDEEELQHEHEGNHAYESLIKQWFQVSTRLDQSFCFYLVSSQLQQLNFIIFVYFKFHFAKLTMNIFLLLFLAWLHWIFNYT